MLLTLHATPEFQFEDAKLTYKKKYKDPGLISGDQLN